MEIRAKTLEARSLQLEKTGFTLVIENECLWVFVGVIRESEYVPLPQCRHVIVWNWSGYTEIHSSSWVLVVAQLGQGV